MHRFRSTIALATLLGVGALTLGACGSDASSSKAPASTKAPAVVIKTFQFTHPAEAKAGTVAVRNDDDTTHTFTSGTPGKPDGTFDVELKGPDATKSITVRAGTYKVYCRIHTSMTGELVVH